VADLAFPYAVDVSGRSATRALEEHVRDLVAQLVYTMVGERVNRPTFGSGLMQLVFAPNSDALAAATQSSLQAALQQWLGDRIEVDAVEVSAADSALLIDLAYRIRLTQQTVQTRFQRSF
jgi:uncharacterized protein